MTPKYYHSPLKPATTRVRCPVCHQEVYSRAGIHPQCAVKQADPPRPKNKPPIQPGVPGPVSVPDGPVEVDPNVLAVLG